MTSPEQCLGFPDVEVGVLLKRRQHEFKVEVAETGSSSMWALGVR
jgi:hypothetical protein